MTEVNVVRVDDLFTYQADVLVAFIDPDCLRQSFVDEAIVRAAGDVFHSQVRVHMPLVDGNVHLALRPDELKKTVTIGSVVFVVDGVQQSLGRIVCDALSSIGPSRCDHVILPLTRTNIEPGGLVYEESIGEVLQQLLWGIDDFITMSSVARHVKKITIAIYKDEDLANTVAQMFGINVAATA